MGYFTNYHRAACVSPAIQLGPVKYSAPLLRTAGLFTRVEPLVPYKCGAQYSIGNSTRRLQTRQALILGVRHFTPVYACPRSLGTPHFPIESPVPIPHNVLLQRGLGFPRPTRSSRSHTWTLGGVEGHRDRPQASAIRVKMSHLALPVTQPRRLGHGSAL